MKRKEYFVRSSHIKYSFSSWNFFLITREKSSRQSLLLKCYIKLLVVNWYRVIPTLWLSIISRLCELTRWNNLYLRELMAYIWYRNGGNVRVSLDNCSCFLFHCWPLSKWYCETKWENYRSFSSKGFVRQCVSFSLN